jgi:hypothetical protein
VRFGLQLGQTSAVVAATVVTQNAQTGPSQPMQWRSSAK